ncbi:MAG: hypothetical protein IPH79_06045 [Sphingomonadales bacterium]|nr:hypothetical protein [Sphingomonadales bacterium]
MDGTNAFTGTSGQGCWRDWRRLELSRGVTFRVAPCVFISGDIAGSTVKRSTGGRVGVAFGF